MADEQQSHRIDIAQPRDRASPVTRRRQSRWLGWGVATAAAILIFAPAAARHRLKAPAAAPSAAPALASGSGGSWFMGGTVSDLPSCGSCEVTLPASGSGTFGTMNNNANGQLSPGVAVVASRLTVHIDTAPGQASRSFILFVRGMTGGLRCDITGTATTCDSGAATAVIPAASIVQIDVANTGGAPATRAQFSWLATPQ